MVRSQQERPLRASDRIAGVVTAVGHGEQRVRGRRGYPASCAPPWSAREYRAFATHSPRRRTSSPAPASRQLRRRRRLRRYRADRDGSHAPGERRRHHRSRRSRRRVGGLVHAARARRGATVIGIASPSNADYLRSLGAIPVSYGERPRTADQDAAPSPVTAFSTASVATRRWPTAPASGERVGTRSNSTAIARVAPALYRRARRKDRRHRNSPRDS